MLVEGHSDAAVVETLVAARGGELTAPAVRVVPMGGITNLRPHLARHGEVPGVLVLGLCDAPEEWFVLRALRDAGRPVTTRDELAALGFFVCVRDLEDELLRAVGADAAEAALSELGELTRFRTFQRQPQWRDRARHEQLHRFAGSGSGRKLALAERLARQLTPATTPRPLGRLVDRIVSAVQHDAVDAEGAIPPARPGD